MPQFAPVDSTVATGQIDTVIVSGDAGRRIRVTHYVLYKVPAGFQFLSSTTPLTGKTAQGLEAGGSVQPVDIHDDRGLFQTEPGEDLVLRTNSSGSSFISGHVTYDVEKA